jgi:hypothetical protein
MNPKVFWIGLVLGLLGISVSIQAVGLVLASSEPSMAIEKDYERKARDWDLHRAQLAANQRLGWQIEKRFEPAGHGRLAACVTLTDREGLALTGVQLCGNTFHNARAAQPEALQFAEIAPGLYRGEFRIARGGLWIFELEAQQADLRFTTTWRSTLEPPQS